MRMAYVGSTAGTTLMNPPMMVGPAAIGGRFAANSTSIAAGSRLWIYNSSDTSTAWMNAGYFTDGARLGMRPGDLLVGVSWSTESSTGVVFVGGVLGTTLSTAGWNLSTGGTVTSTFT